MDFLVDGIEVVEAGNTVDSSCTGCEGTCEGSCEGTCESGCGSNCGSK